MVQVQRLRDLPGSPVAALKYLSSSVTYRGSRGDLARAKRYYTETGENTYVRNAYDEALLIYGKEKLYRIAKRGLLTYPGWRVDVSKALRSHKKTSNRRRVSSIGNRNSTTRWATAYARGSGHSSLTSSTFPAQRGLSSFFLIFFMLEATLRVALYFSVRSPIPTCTDVRQWL